MKVWFHEELFRMISWIQKIFVNLQWEIDSCLCNLITPIVTVYVTLETVTINLRMFHIRKIKISWVLYFGINFNSIPEFFRDGGFLSLCHLIYLFLMLFIKNYMAVENMLTFS